MKIKKSKEMKFKQVMGYIYLTIFLGVMGWKFNSFIEDSPNAAVITFLSVLILIVILLAIRRILRDD